MVIRKKEKKTSYKIFAAIIASSIMALNGTQILYASEMPTGANVQTGDVTITGTDTNHLIINQRSSKSIINWKSFSIHSGGTVDFNMPSSNSMSLKLST